MPYPLFSYADYLPEKLRLKSLCLFGQASNQHPSLKKSYLGDIFVLYKRHWIAAFENDRPFHYHAVSEGGEMGCGPIPSNRKGKDSMDKDAVLRRFEFLKQDYSQGFIADCGIEAVTYEEGYLESRLTILNKHRQQDHYIHAGVLATMADHTAGYAAFSLVSEEMRILTIEFKINFLEPAYGHTLICRSRILREGSQIFIGESEVFDQRNHEEALAAKALVTLMAVHQSKIKPVRISGS